MRRIQSLAVALALGSALLFGCKKEKDEPQTTGFVEGVVKDGASGAALGDVKIIFFDADNNSPTGATITTGADGTYKAEMLPGKNYYAKLYKHGYENVPAREMSAVPFSVTAPGEVVNQPYEMFKSAVTNGGTISGKVMNGSTPMGGVLVVAYDGTTGHSSVTDAEGKYNIYNVPVGSYQVKGWIGGYNSTQVPADVTTNSTIAADLSLTEGASNQVTGQVSFLATQNIEVDVALTHPGTKETIPGLTTVTSGGTYTITGVPVGRYLARATYKNDAKVMDPDWIMKNGEPYVIVEGGSATRNFSVTGAVTVNSPSNTADMVVPVESGPTPTFTWTAYSSTSDYVIEVMDASSGKVIWGGFSDNWNTKNITIPSSRTSIVFNEDGRATEQLMPGKVYRWKIYASKDDGKELRGWSLISVSEDQRGLIKIN